MTDLNAKYQYCAAIVVNLMTIGYGFNCGWGSPNLYLLMSDDSPLPSGKITIEQASWIAASICIGGVIGNLISGLITEKFGRKIPLLLGAIPLTVAWLLILYAQNVYYLYAARAISGMVGSGIFIMTPLYLSEIACDKVRGILGSTLVFAYNVGVLIALVVGNYFTYDISPKIVIVFLISFMILFYFFPDTPVSLVRRDRLAEARKSIKFYRNLSNDDDDQEILQKEISKLRKAIGGGIVESTEHSLKWSDFQTREFRKSITIGIVLVALNQLSGCFALLNYTATIFKESGSNMPPNASAIVVGSIQLVGACVSVYLVDCAGRKLLMTLSCIGSALGLICFGTYLMLKNAGHNIEFINWIPVSSLSFVIFTASLGIFTLPYLIIAEIMPEKVKNFSTSLCMELSWFFTFIMLKYLPKMIEIFGLDGSMFLFAGVCVVSAIYILICMPETKQRSYEEIMASLR